MLIFNAQLSEDNAKEAHPLVNKATFEAAMRLCTYIDNDNASTAMGVLEFMDKMSKFGKVNTVCHVEDWDGDFAMNHATPELTDTSVKTDE